MATIENNKDGDRTENWPVGTEFRDGDHGIGIWRHFRSLDALMSIELNQEAKNMKGETTARLFGDSEEEEPETAWHGGLGSLKAFRKKHSKGWPEGVAKMQKTLKLLKPPSAASIKRKRVRSDVGDSLDIHRVYAGRFDTAWERRRRDKAPGKRIVRIFVELTASSGRPPATLFWRGAVATILTAALEKAGYRVEVVGYNMVDQAYVDAKQLSGRGNARTTVQSLTIKRSDQAMSLEKLVLCCAHASMYRTVFFASYHGYPKGVSWGYGLCNHQPPPFAGDKDIVIRNIWDSQAAQKALNNLAAKYA